MVRRLVLDGDGVAVVIGQAGTGRRSRSPRRARRGKASGYRVVGAALARRAAIELEDGAGIESTSIAALLEELRRRPLASAAAAAVLVIDEAGMVPTRALAEIVEHVERPGRSSSWSATIGSCRRSGPAGRSARSRGGCRRSSCARIGGRTPCGSARRSRCSATGDAEGAVGGTPRAGGSSSGEDGDAVRRRLVADWWTAGDPDGAVMIAHRRRDVADLNGRAHALMRAAGALGDEEVATAVQRRRRRPRGAAAERSAAGRRERRARDRRWRRRGGGELDVELRGRRVRLDRGVPRRTSGARSGTRSPGTRRRG